MRVIVVLKDTFARIEFRENWKSEKGQVDKIYQKWEQEDPHH